MSGRNWWKGRDTYDLFVGEGNSPVGLGMYVHL